MSKKAFTLIELLIVIAILGILVALILPRFGDVRDDANTKVCVANLRGLASAMATYETRWNDSSVAWGTSPYDIPGLVTLNYIAQEPDCPSGGNYTLVSGATGDDMDTATCSLGPSGDNSEPDHVWP